MADLKLLCFPAERKPSSSSSVQYWSSGGPHEYVSAQPTRVAGNITTSNGYTFGSNTNGDRRGDAITSSGGLSTTVVTGTNNWFYTSTYVGDPAGAAYNGSTIDGPNFVGSYADYGAKSTWMQGVKGFICEISDRPYPDDGSAASDNCGGAGSFRISGVFVDNSRRIRVIDMCQGGTKITGHTWNTRPADRGWKIMSYYSSTSNDMLDWWLIGWSIQLEHHRYCGGTSKNCTGRVRYLQPLISRDSGGPLYTGNPDRYAVCGKFREWRDRDNGAIMTF